jgi:hypothetical protein
MQFLGAASLLLCVVSMVSVVTDVQWLAVSCFGVALLMMGASLVCLMVEVWISGGALRILLRNLEAGRKS